MKKLNFLIAFLISGISGQAQLCNGSILFKKGAQLQYKNYFPLYSKDEEQLEATRVTIEVTDVVTNGNITTSSITKKEVSPTNKNYNFEIKSSVSCNEKEISIPYNFYAPDTVYKCDAKKDLKGTGFATAYRIIGDTLIRIYPFLMIKNMDFGSAKVTVETSTGATKAYSYSQFIPDRNGGRDVITKVPASPPGKFTQVAECKNIKVEGKETVSTPAGDFECFKISYEAETSYNGIKVKYKTVEYYAPEIGIVKGEFIYNKMKATTMELVKIRK